MSPVHHRLTRSFLAALAAFVLLLSACSDADPGDELAEEPQTGESQPQSSDAASQAPALPAIELAARPGPFQMTVDSRPEQLSNGASVEIFGTDGALLAESSFTESGSLLVRDLPPGEVDIQVVDGSDRYRAQPLTIPGEDPQDASIDQSFYDGIELSSGYTYIPTRDGTTLSAFITLPGSATGGPYPTIVEYSGYSPSDPTATTDPNRLLIPTLGYALVQVNVRGTGCSGGSFDAFERIQSLDGYDVIEAVAAQPWSARVGMFGVSYPGIMQLHVASTRPPSLAAIASFSVTDGVDSVLYPGGIFNDGFGQEWTNRVSEQAEAEGQAWAADRVARGDKTCAANQALREHNPDLVAMIKQEQFAGPLSEQRSASTFADQIDVPTMLAGAWQDEQTGGRFPELLDELDNAPVLRAIMYNGLHSDAISGEMLVRIIEFLNLYVGDRSAEVDPVARILMGTGLSTIFGSPLPLPEGRYDGLSADQARAAFEAEPPIEILFEQGAQAPNLPVPSFRAQFSEWPPAQTEPTELFVGPDRSGQAGLDAEPPTAETTWSFVTDPEEGGAVTISDPGRIWTSDPGWSWPQPDPQNSLSATSDALDQDLVLVGNMSVDLWVSLDEGSNPDAGDAEFGDADLEVTVSEVHPDGSEVYVQAGWLRLSQRALADDATEMKPLKSRAEDDVSLLEPGEPVLARIEVLPFAHVFRQGSRLRVTVDTPGASRPEWRFAVAPEPVGVTIHTDPGRPSKLVLPVVPDVEVTTERPACGALRGQPCRSG